MPQDGSGNYQYPLGTRGVTDETIESAAYNNFLDDLVGNDLNIPRPIHRGGTGGTTADEALANIGAEKAAQLVTNYDTQVWFPGSFRSAGSATGAPVAGHAFAGIVYINEPLASPPTNANVTVSARDMDDTVVPSRVYVREKKANVWGAWTVIDATTLPFPPGGGIAGDTIIEAIQELDTEKASITYVDTTAAAAAATKVAKSGGADGIMTGFLTLNADPTALLHATTKQYVDNTVAAAIAGFIPGSELRFNRASSQYMTRTFGTTSSSPWTLSMWVRRNSLGTHQALFGVEVSSNKLHIAFEPGNKLAIYVGSSGTTILSPGVATYTSLGAWYNIVWTSVTAAAAPTSKVFDVKVNNTTDYGFATTDPGLNTNIAHYIGQPAGYPDVFMKEVIFVDGSALPPTSFGVDASGVWSPKIFGGPYGTNGFKLSFSNQLSAANLGIDSSPNGNHWTPVNF